MKKALRICGIVVAALLGLVLLVLIAVPILLNSRVTTRLVDKYAAEYLDADLSYSRLSVHVYRDLPCVGIVLEDAVLTDPHERFAAYDTLPAPSPLLEAGRGPVKDTLARFGSLTLSADAVRLIRDREIIVEKIALERFAAFAHDYGEAVNWDILRLPPSEKSSKGLDLPWIQLKELRIDGSPEIVYTAQRRGIYADARFRDLKLLGDAKIDSTGFRLRGVRLALDSLKLSGQAGGNGLDADLSLLRLAQRAEQEFDLALSADALLRTEAYGEMDPEAIFTFEIAQLPGAESVSVGDRVYLRDPYGQPIPVKVAAKDETSVTFDANHEMAGKELNFTIELVEVLE